MNHLAHSVECVHDMCSACRFEDCACECHAIERDRLRLLRQLQRERDPQLTPREMYLEQGGRAFRDAPRGQR